MSAADTDHPGATAGGFRVRRAPARATPPHARRAGRSRGRAGGPRRAPRPVRPVRRQRLQLRGDDRARSPRGRGRHPAGLRAADRVLARYEDRGTPFLSWLLRLARNAAIDQVRARRALPVADPIEPPSPCRRRPRAPRDAAHRARRAAGRPARDHRAAPPRRPRAGRDRGPHAPHRERGARAAPPRAPRVCAPSSPPGRCSGDAHSALSTTRCVATCCYGR